MLQHLMGLVTVAVPRRPLIHLALRPAGEPQQLPPVTLHKEQHTGDGAVLGIIGIPEGFSGHMDVQAAGACLVREITLRNSLVQYLIPRHFVELVPQRQGVCDDLKAVVQTAIVLAVGKGVLPVGNVQQGRGVLTVLARTIDLQLHAKETGPGAVENGTRLEIVIVDGAVFDVGTAVAAVRVIVVVGVPALIKGDEAAAAGAAGVVSIIAVGAKGRGRCVAVVPMPEACAAVGTDLCHAIQTVRAQQAVMELDRVF